MTSSLPTVDLVCRAAGPVEGMGAEAAADLAARFKALGDPTRLRLLSIIAAQPESEACVCNLTEPIGLSQGTVSHHLKVLVDAGLLTRARRGTWSFYALAPGALEELAAALGTPSPTGR
ncbi:ArsR/SmtB family transcription factor [Aeromicrobium sp. CTD01-1L150]|uniref:ArsR/SmtB family transcription factor n=1 Tax=Aeromicrobium sp. CTD01-1L150 TaxID=3341830 RepID=UPI0035C0F656